MAWIRMQPHGVMRRIYSAALGSIVANLYGISDSARGVAQYSDHELEIWLRWQRAVAALDCYAAAHGLAALDRMRDCMPISYRWERAAPVTCRQYRLCPFCFTRMLYGFYATLAPYAHGRVVAALEVASPPGDRVLPTRAGVTHVLDGIRKYQRRVDYNARAGGVCCMPVHDPLAGRWVAAGVLIAVFDHAADIRSARSCSAASEWVPYYGSTALLDAICGHIRYPLRLLYPQTEARELWAVWRVFDGIRLRFQPQHKEITHVQSVPRRRSVRRRSAPAAADLVAAS